MLTNGDKLTVPEPLIKGYGNIKGNKQVMMINYYGNPANLSIIQYSYCPNNDQSIKIYLTRTYFYIFNKKEHVNSGFNFLRIKNQIYLIIEYFHLQ